jgi:ABC-2 type transport system ATP-binding protein
MMSDRIRGRTGNLPELFARRRPRAGALAADVGAGAHAGVLIRGLRKRFGGVTALDGVDLDVRPGEIVALLGPNGAGKSTLTRIIATTVLPDAGLVRVAGVDVVAQPPAARRCIGLTLGDERSWFWRLSGRHNLEFFAALYGLPRKAAAVRADELLATVGLAEAADRRFDGYSTGMKMRLSLARALLPNPRILLLDEPTRSLDPVAAVEFREHVLALARSRDMAVLYTTHDLHEASAIASRLVVIAHGALLTELPRGTEAAVLEQALLRAVAR